MFKLIQNIALLILFLLPGTLLSQRNLYVALSTSKVRPIGMGSAFTAIEDALAAISFNPAAYFLAPGEEIPRLTMFINPVSPIVGGANHSELYNGSGSPVDDFLLGLGLFLKSVSFNLNAVQLGVTLSEQSLSTPELFTEDEFFGVSGFRQNHSHSVVGRLQLAEKVSLGASANFLFGRSRQDPMKRYSDIGISYGVLLRPEKGLNVGVSFVNMPDSLVDFRLPLERIVDESINIGVSYEMFTKTLLSLDVRNLGEESGMIIREVHVGIEQVLLSHLALRAGFFNKQQGQNVFSCGIGLLSDSLLSRSRSEGSGNFYLNYAFVYEQTPVLDLRWHLLSFLLKI
jgi:hypothetical protein